VRILGFSKKWPKLRQPWFTTFRFTRRDKDWQAGEIVQVVYKPRSKEREVLGPAEIIAKEPRAMARHGNRVKGALVVTNAEAERDGFSSIVGRQAYFLMWEYLFDFYGGERLMTEPMNKLTLRWVNGHLVKENSSLG